ncbi:MAG: NADH-quinone oxidoreductase subunit C [Puniceicoccales bacterium]|jgi:NADH-quinone oxidoreductase subunit C|nr:NADH-quinone oxidoreductase subunit C [Puniceicoccales bacterium]
MSLYDPESILSSIAAAFPEITAATLITNTGSSAQHSLLLDKKHAVAVAVFLRDDINLRLDYCSNVTGVDSLKAGYLEVVYHLYSIEKKSTKPVVLRLRTDGREGDTVQVPSLVPVWRSCELQEREIYDLFGVVFTGHPDLRRLLMWDAFEDYPMRKDYTSPEEK